MSLNLLKPEYKDEFHWWFNDDTDKDWANQQWGCYQGCNLVIMDENKTNLQEIDLSDNNCLNWKGLPLSLKDTLRSGEAYCAQIICTEQESKIQCWNR